MPNLPLFFARRYLFSKKSHSVINIISRVSSFAVAIPVMAMVILLSVFNGFENLIKSMYQAFDPDIMITASRGKVFNIEKLSSEKLVAVDGVEAVSYLLEEMVVFEYSDRQMVGMLRGADENYNRIVEIDSLIVNGEYHLKFGDMDEACAGQGVAYTLGIRTNFYDPLTIYALRRGRINPLLPYSIFREGKVFPSGVFALESEVDGQYVLADLAFAQQLFDYEGSASSVVVKLKPGVVPESIRDKIAEAAGDDFKVLTRYQQKETFYRIMVYEKWGIYFIILLVLVVASFSLIGSLAMLIIDKRKDMQTLIKLGADIPLVRRIFVAEGMLTYGLGGFLGLVFGVLLAFLQQQFGFIGMGGQTFLIDAYPVEIRLSDLGWIIVTFVAVSFLISHLTVRAMISKNDIRLG